MSTLGVNKSPDQINALLVKFLPECASKYATYPMKRDRWYLPNEKGSKGEPLFLKQPDAGVKMDYVFGRGPGGPGYYSLLTKTAYINLYSRHTSACPVTCCACSKAAREAYDEWDDVKRIIFARQLAKKPNDVTAATDAMSEATGKAQAWHNGLQNEACKYKPVRMLGVGVLPFYRLWHLTIFP
jgi:hypothetical protein